MTSSRLMALAGSLLLALPCASSASAWGHVVGKPFPALSLPSLSGGTVTLAPKGAKALLAVYVRLDQERSQRVLERAASWHRQYAKEGLAVVAIATARHGGREAMTKFLRGRRLPFPVAIDAHEAFRGAGELFVYPTSWVVDAKFVVRYAYAGIREDYPVLIERAVRGQLGLPVEEVAEAEEPPDAETKKQDRQSRMRELLVRRSLELARQRLAAARNLLTPEALPLVLKLYREWATQLPLPADESSLARAAERIRRGEKLPEATLAALRKLAGRAELKAPAQLWLGRALLLRRKHEKPAQQAFEACLGTESLRGQCEFELAALLAAEDAGRAVELCRAGLVRVLAEGTPAGSDKPGTKKGSVR